MNYIEQVRKHQYRIERYIHIITWARRRYTDDGTLVVDIGGVPGAYSKIEKMAWDKYMD